MSAAETKRDYRAFLKETVAIRRYSGVGGSRTSTDKASIGHVAKYAAKQIAGQIKEGDLKVIVYADTLITNGLTLPVTTYDKLVFEGKEYAILEADHNTLRDDGDLIAIILQVRG